MRKITKKPLLLKRENLERLSREVARRYNGHHHWRSVQVSKRLSPRQAKRKVEEWMKEIERLHGKPFLDETLHVVGDGAEHSLAELIQEQRWKEAFQVIQNLDNPLY